MPFAIASEHTDFFAKNHFIEFEDLLTPEEAAKLKEKADAVLDERVKKRSHRPKTTEEYFLLARNLWKSDPAIKKLLHRKEIHEIASTLLKKPILRLAYDQYFRTEHLEKSSFFSQPLTLQQISSFQYVVGGLILRLNEENPQVPPSPQLCPIPRKIGSGMFLNPSLPLNLAPLLEIPRQNLILIVYCKDKTVYALEKNDPLTHELKKEGYAFGDLLKGDTHPILFRK